MKNKKQLILTITLVLTLVLVIAGATFAFFSAAGNSTDNAVRAGATNLAGTISITTTTKKAATNLIPVASQDTNFQRYPKREGHICEDDLGNEICSLYEFTITNTANVSQEVYVSFKPTTNGYDNLYFATFNTTATSATYNVATAYTNGSLTAVSASDNSTIGHPATKLTKNNTNEIAMPGLTTIIPSSGSVTYTVLVWLQETGDNQNAEQGASFAAGIVASTGNGEGVTGELSDGYTWVYTRNQVTMITEDYADPSTTVGIGQPIPAGITQYTSIGDNYPYLLHKIANGPTEVWCADIEGGMNSCDSMNRGAFSETECYQLISALGYTGTCSSRISSNVVVESYVRARLVQKYDNISGYWNTIITLQGGDMGASYEANISEMDRNVISEYGYCSYPHSDGEVIDTNSYGCSYVLHHDYTAQSLAYSTGKVQLSYFPYSSSTHYYCTILNAGISSCSVQYDNNNE